MEAEWRLKVITDLISWIFGKQNWRCGMNWMMSKSSKVCVKIWCFWSLTASTTLEVKNDHAHVIAQGICNQFIELNFSVGCMVSQPNWLFHRQLPCLLLIRFHVSDILYEYTWPKIIMVIFIGWCQNAKMSSVYFCYK